jgi:RNA-directed DNA polymerase
MVIQYLKDFGADLKIQPSLTIATDGSKKRFASINPEANPYDSQWDIYFEEWEYAKRFYTKDGYNRLESAYSRQNGICPVCKEKISTNFSIHADQTSNRTHLKLLHPECHRTVHEIDLQIMEVNHT